MANIINLEQGNVNDIINNLNSNFENLKQAFEYKKVDTDALVDETIANGLRIHSITSEKIEDGSVTSEKIEDGSITSENIEDGSITLNKFEDESANSLYKNVLYTRSIFISNSLKDTFPAGSIVLYYRDSPIEYSEDEECFEGVF